MKRESNQASSWEKSRLALVQIKVVNAMGYEERTKPMLLLEISFGSRLAEV